jgi:hypothetical protein
MKTGTKKLVFPFVFTALFCSLIFYLQPWAKGRIKLIGRGVSIELRDIWGRCTSLTSDDEALEVFAGTYRPKLIQVTSPENDSPEFAIQCKGPWGKLSQIKVKKDETTVIECGPPFKAVAKVSRRERVVSVGYSIIGKAGEDYSSAFGWPEVTVLDEKENVLAMGRFGAG